MSDKKISALPVATVPLSGTEVLPVVQGGTTDQVSVANLTAGRAVSMLSSAVANDLAVGGATASAFEGNVRAVVGSGSGVPILTLYGGSNTYGGVYFSDGTTGNEKYRGFLEYNHSTDVLAIGTAGGTKLSVSSDGNLVIGTAGKGIDFSADGQAAGMTSELLDDYEEGTWTPAVSSFTGTLTSYTAIGRYTKIGRMVYIYCSVQITDAGTGTGNLTIAGYPFTSVNAGYDQAAIGIWREVNATGATGASGLPKNSTSGTVLTGGTGIATGYAFIWNLAYEAA